ncbi:unnamed protein product [Tilletia laevis]|uniref:Uncharacterized protein n=2 Tax=Tilletia TaxID=13289 RepID=A0A9N8LEY5_9BASI|nr:unnamed protein product [Tilletia caries]CAD6910855.1 unnamed protein product [Tilletia caries]CAD6913204.1 unnamed protein product [Tilletia laevis]CAD6965558.1 unnamed protein product [Tilletia laevis]
MMKAFQFVTATALLALALTVRAAPWTQNHDSTRMDSVEPVIPSLGFNFSWGLRDQPYDYIVIGGGTAGLVIAARLSEDPSKSVAVIEAGDTLSCPVSPVSDANRASIYGLQYDYQFYTQPGPKTPAKYWPRGKVLGGSSALNFLLWDRGSKHEYDAWEELGNKGWNWSNMYRYMRKAEQFFSPPQDQQDRLHFSTTASDYGSSGPIKVSFPKCISEQAQNWVPALNSLGLPVNNQPLAGDNIGASLHPSSSNPINSTRSYTAVAYYLPNAARPNLKVFLNSTVTKMNFTGSKDRSGNVRASSVSFQTSKKTHSLRVQREVIVAAGVVNSPQILELSGIGNQKILKAAGIPTLVNLHGVGENLQDHTGVYAAYELKNGHITLDSLRNDPEFATQQRILYKQNLASRPSIYTEATNAVAYVSLDTIVGTDKAKSMVDAATSYVAGFRTPYNVTLRKQLEFLKKYPDTVGQMELIGFDGYYASTGTPEVGKTYITFVAAQQHLFARGHIHINTSNPLSAPIIVPHYFENDFDIEVSVAGTEYLRKIANAPNYASYIATEVIPGAQADMAQFVRDTAATEYHGIGTCSMLPRNQGGVVDNKLVVYGTSNVRVADASIIPLHVATHLQGTVYGIGEFAADIIKGHVLQ